MNTTDWLEIELAYFELAVSHLSYHELLSELFAFNIVLCIAIVFIAIVCIAIVFMSIVFIAIVFISMVFIAIIYIAIVFIAIVFILISLTSPHHTLESISLFRKQWKWFGLVLWHIIPCCLLNAPDNFLPPCSIIHCFRQVFRAASRIGTEFLYVGSSWSSCLCSSMRRGPLEYIRRYP